MVHIATVHWRSDRWIDVQLRYLKANVAEPYKVYAWLDQELRAHAHEFFYATDVPVERHELKLTLLGDLVANAADPDEVIIFIDGDAFPVAPIMPFLRSKLERYPLVAVRRDENNGDRQPHPSFCATTAGFWRELPGDWRRGHTWINPQGGFWDVGSNWSTGVAPGPEDDVLISVNSGATITKTGSVTVSGGAPVRFSTAVRPMPVSPTCDGYGTKPPSGVGPASG